MPRTRGTKRKNETTAVKSRKSSKVDEIVDKVLERLAPKLQDLREVNASDSDSDDEVSFSPGASGSKSDIASAISELLKQGEESSAANDFLNSNQFIPLSTGIPLESGVDKKIVVKIISNEYINLAHLLDKIPGESELTVTIKQRASSVTTNPSKPRHEIKTYDQWSTAFHVFIAVYCKVHSD
ncbi:unnamed protein product, partial [Owenia fusiformis]